MKKNYQVYIYRFGDFVRWLYRRFSFGFALDISLGSMNTVINKPPYQVSEKPKSLHEKLCRGYTPIVCF